MRLYAKCHPDYFAMLGDGKFMEYQQIERITLENQETHEVKEFHVENIRKVNVPDQNHIKRIYSKVPWDEHLPIFAIELGDEIKTEKAPAILRTEFERPEKTWHGVGD